MQSLFKKITIQTLLGGIAAYVGAKQTGGNETQAIVVGVISALTSAFGTAHGASE